MHVYLYMHITGKNIFRRVKQQLSMAINKSVIGVKKQCLHQSFVENYQNKEKGLSEHVSSSETIVFFVN